MDNKRYIYAEHVKSKLIFTLATTKVLCCYVYTMNGHKTSKLLAHALAVGNSQIHNKLELRMVGYMHAAVQKSATTKQTYMKTANANDVQLIQNTTDAMPMLRVGVKPIVD